MQRWHHCTVINTILLGAWGAWDSMEKSSAQCSMFVAVHIYNTCMRPPSLNPASFRLWGALKLWTLAHDRSQGLGDAVIPRKHHCFKQLHGEVSYVTFEIFMAFRPFLNMIKQRARKDQREKPETDQTPSRNSSRVKPELDSRTRRRASWWGTCHVYRRMMGFTDILS